MKHRYIFVFLIGIGLMPKMAFGQCPVTVNAGPDVTVCANQSSVNVSGDTTGVAGIIWSTTGTGSFVNQSFISTVYIPGAADIAAGSVTIYLTTVGGPCSPAEDAFVITFVPAPVVDAGADQTVCGKSNVSLDGEFVGALGAIWTTSGSGSFTPNAASVNATYTPSVADTAAGNITLTLTTTSSGICASVSDTKALTFLLAPSVSAGPDIVVCSSVDPVQLSATTFGSVASVTWQTNGSGSFSNDHALNPVYVPKYDDLTSGVILMVTAFGTGPCGTVGDAVNAWSRELPTVNLGPDTIICASSVLSPIYATVSVPANVFQWSTTGTGTFSNANSINSTYTPSAADIAGGSVNLLLNASDGTCSGSNYLNVTILEDPSGNAGLDQVVQSTASSVQLAATTNNATYVNWGTSGSGTFSNHISVNSLYMPSAADIAAGSVTLTLYASTAGCTDQDQVVITFSDEDLYNLSGSVLAGENLADKVFLTLYKNTDNIYVLVDSVISSTGAYTFENLEEGSYIVYAHPAFISSVFESYLPTYLGGVSEWIDATVVEVAGSDLSGKDISLIPFTSPNTGWNTGDDVIEGTVILDAENLKLASGAKQTPNASIYLYDEDNKLLAYTSTDINGHYEFTNLVSGTYILSVQYPGASTPVPLQVNVDGNPATISNGSFTVEKQSVVSGINVSSKTVNFVNAYPNPTLDEVNIDLADASTYQVSIVNAEGRVVSESVVESQGDKLTISTSSLAPGIYLIKAAQDDKLFKTKIYKQ